MRADVSGADNANVLARQAFMPLEAEFAVGVHIILKAASEAQHHKDSPLHDRITITSARVGEHDVLACQRVCVERANLNEGERNEDIMKPFEVLGNEHAVAAYYVRTQDLLQPLVTRVGVACKGQAPDSLQPPDLLCTERHRSRHDDFHVLLISSRHPLHSAPSQLGSPQARNYLAFPGADPRPRAAGSRGPGKEGVREHRGGGPPPKSPARPTPPQNRRPKLAI